MRTGTRLLSATIGLGLMIMGPAAGADTGDCRLIRGAATPDPADDVEVCRLDTWVHTGGTRLGNLSAAQGTVPSWDATQPTTSLQDGGGGYASVRFVEILLPRDTKVMPTFAGGYTGVLDNLATTIYLSCPAYQATATPYPLSVALTIDGETVVDRTPLDTFVDVPITPVTEAYGYMKVAFTNLYSTLAALGLDNAEGTQHTIEIQIMNQFWADGNAVVLYDATDAPTGNVFNIETSKLSGFTKIDTLAENS